MTDLPGVTVVVSKGPEGDRNDTVFGQMFIAGEYRWMLENMQVSRRSGGESKVLPHDVIEKKFESILIASGEDGLNAYRDTLRETAVRLGMAFRRINKLITALLATHEADVLKTPYARALSVGFRFDENRKRLFDNLFDALQEQHLFRNKCHLRPSPNTATLPSLRATSRTISRARSLRLARHARLWKHESPCRTTDDLLRYLTSRNTFKGSDEAKLKF